MSQLDVNESCMAKEKGVFQRRLYSHFVILLRSEMRNPAAFV
jgi:hypothetical protein